MVCKQCRCTHSPRSPCVCVCVCISTRSLLKNESDSKERKWTDHFETPHRLGKMEDFFPPSLCLFLK